LLGREGQGAGLLPDFGGGGRADGLAALSAEQESVGRHAESADIRDEDGRDGDDADFGVCAVPEAAFLVGRAGVGPLDVDFRA
jgi:hypothetical protein